MTDKALIELANKARESSYCPYSGFAVGAALLCADGEVVLGCNIENSSYTPTVCAERVAIFSAVSKGKRDFVAIAISGGKANGEPMAVCPPCGVCRQVLSEFCSPSMRIIFDDGSSTTLGELLPLSFSLDKN